MPGQGLLSGDDLGMVRLAPVPDAAPPYDGDSRPGAHATAEVAFPAARTVATGKAAGSFATHSGSQDGPAGGDEDWPRQFAQVLAEVLAGSRPARQIIPWTTQRARIQFSRVGSLLACGQRPRILRVVTSRPAPDVMEMTVVAGFGPRTRALAVRFERTARHRPTPGQRPTTPGWLCTAIETA